MKKFFKISGVALACVIAIVVIMPYALRGPIERVVKEEINSMVDAKVDYNDFSLSIFSSFPNLRAGIEGLSIIGNGKFEDDTLAYIGRFDADIDIMSLFGDEYVVNALILEHPVVRAIVASDSVANWDIYSSADTSVVEEVDTASTALNLNLNKVKIVNGDVVYADSTSNLFATIRGLDVDLSGRMDDVITDVSVALDIASLGVEMDKINYLDGSTVDFDANIEADLSRNKFTFKENTLNFSGVPLSFDGWVELKDSSTLVDLRLAASKTDFKTLLAIVPDYIMKDVEGLRMDGDFELYADVDGEYVDMEHIPAFDVAFKVNNGKVKYPDLPKSLNDINVDLSLKNPGGSADLTVVDVNKLHFELGSNPFDAYLNVVTPISNATFKAGVNGIVDLTSLKDALPLDSMTIGGVVSAKLNVVSDMKSIEREDYEKVKADGVVNLTDFTFDGAALPACVTVSEAKLVFTPKFLQLDPLKATLGQSDFNASGKVDNYLSYLLSDGVISGTLSLASNMINCNELMGESTSASIDTTSVQVDESSMAVEVPKNIDFVLNANIGKLLYDKLTITDVNGGVVVRNGVATLKNLKLAACEGVMSLDGSYSSVDVTKPTIDMAVKMVGVDVNALTNSFSTIDSLLPIAKSAHGKVSITMNIVSDLGQDMSPIIKTMQGKGSFRSESLALKNSEFQQKLSSILGTNKYNDLTMKNVGGSFTIVDGDIVISPFDINMLNKVAKFSGRQGLDKSLDYLMSIPVSREEIALAVKKTGLKIDVPLEGDDVPLGITIGGTLTSPKVGLDADALKSVIEGEVKAVVKEKVTEVIDQAKEKVVEKLESNEKVQEAKETVKNSLEKLIKKGKK